MTWLGLDLASRLTGWCCGDGAEPPLCGAWELPDCRNLAEGGNDYGLLLQILEQYLDVAFQRFAPRGVAYEAPILISRGRGAQRYGDDLGKLRLLYPLGAFVEYYCRREGVSCWEVTVGAIKKQVTGNAYAEKDDLVAVARNVGLALPPGEGAKDAADAFGAWLLLLRHKDPARSQEWDRRIWTPKGSLL